MDPTKFSFHKCRAQATQIPLPRLYCLTDTNDNFEKWEQSDVGREIVVAIFENSLL